MSANNNSSSHNQATFAPITPAFCIPGIGGGRSPLVQKQHVIVQQQPQQLQNPFITMTKKRGPGQPQYPQTNQCPHSSENLDDNEEQQPSMKRARTQQQQNST
jgi:hypothetical protein